MLGWRTLYGTFFYNILKFVWVKTISKWSIIAESVKDQKVLHENISAEDSFQIWKDKKK